MTNAAGVLCLVDYAHTPDALERALDVLRPLSTGRVLVVFGCGGDRDKGKRPRMGQAAAERADVVLITSDNPRTEDPIAILDMIVAGVERTGIVRRTASELRQGLSGYHVEVGPPDGHRAWRGPRAAGGHAAIAGKGHEDYQILGTRRFTSMIARLPRPLLPPHPLLAQGLARRHDEICGGCSRWWYSLASQLLWCMPRGLPSKATTTGLDPIFHLSTRPSCSAIPCMPGSAQSRLGFQAGSPFLRPFLIFGRPGAFG